MNLPIFPQLASETGGLIKVGRYDDQEESGVDNGELSEECSSNSTFVCVSTHMPFNSVMILVLTL